MASRHPLLGPSLTIDCATCPGRGHACGDCLVTALIRSGPPGQGDGTLMLDDDERAAVDAVARAGLVTPAVGAAARAQRLGPSCRATG